MHKYEDLKRDVGFHSNAFESNVLYASEVVIPIMVLKIDLKIKISFQRSFQYILKLVT